VNRLWYALTAPMTSVNLNQFLMDAYRRQKQGDFKTAETMYRHALAQYPDHPDVLNLLATLAIDLRKPEPALPLLKRAIALHPSPPGYHINLSHVLRMLRRRDEALTVARRAAAMAPNESAVHSALSLALMETGQFDEALAENLQAVRLDPKSFEATLSLSSLYVKMLRLSEAIEAADRALALRPDSAAAHWNKALASLTAGDFETGWREFEWRLACFPNLRRNFEAPPWKQQDLSGKTILLHCEGGIGDAIQFVRYVPLIKHRAGRVILECPPPLADLFRALKDGPDELIVRGAALPPFDFHCPLQSLPFNFGTTLRSVPSSVPYLHADPQKVEGFRARMTLGERSLKVGLCWTGSPNPDDIRSRTLETFAPLGSMKCVTFYSLQVGPSATEVAQPENARLAVVGLSEELRDFADLAGAIANLDLVISVDTSVAHLAGALGRDVWTLIPLVPDFRWMLGREDSPWYPTMRLFRQRRRTDWDEPLARMADALRERVGTSG
jgi:tetratricopeptide (TPR) repeat protein